MNITVNNKQQTVEASITLLQLINDLNIEKNGIAVAIHQDIITKANWGKTQLNESDAITIITATQGG